MSLGSLCSVVKALIVSLVRQTEQGTMSPIELLWTAKKTGPFENFKFLSFQPYLLSNVFVCPTEEGQNIIGKFLIELFGSFQQVRKRTKTSCFRQLNE